MRQQPSTTILAPLLTLGAAVGAVAGAGAQRDLPVARERIDAWIDTASGVTSVLPVRTVDSDADDSDADD
ncbi:MAG TPA: hypothetical protein VMT85_14990 [Thermoanaerobaculia bacterium]|nr:hypothetical protein [Thermoanaerobaculia bacterium]